jgi:hypothetical protein
LVSAKRDIIVIFGFVSVLILWLFTWRKHTEP